MQLLADPAGALDQLRNLGVSAVRVSLPWVALAPAAISRMQPQGFDGSSPAAYPPSAWAPYDAIVRDALKRRMAVLLNVGGPAPVWATERGEPEPGPVGVWKPSAAAFGRFVRAVGTRYDGRYRPPGESRPLPRVSLWSVWNEPNYGPDLAPQATDHSTVEVSPRLYRGLLDAAWAALNVTGHGGDTILFGELAPRGVTVDDQPGNYSGMVPLRFLRALYCVNSSFEPLQGAAAAVRGCPATPSGTAAFPRAHPALFEASGFAIHPYPDGSLAPNVRVPGEPDYADLASLPELEHTLDRAQGAYGEDRHLPIYSTEFGYITDPPARTIRGTPLSLAADYLNWAEYISWRDPRVRSYDQYLLKDGTVGEFASGLEFADGTPKPSLDAFRIPIYLPVRTADKRQPLEVWGCVRPAYYARLDTGAVQVAQLQFRGQGDRSFQTIRRIVLVDPAGYFDLRIVFPTTGTVRIAWSYPHGHAIYSRAVMVTLR